MLPSATSEDGANFKSPERLWVELAKQQTQGYHLPMRKWSKEVKRDPDTTRWRHRAKYDPHLVSRIFDNIGSQEWPIYHWNVYFYV